MNQQYLLLRSNRQTGPFSLQHLLQFDLTPRDLVWVEGHSAGWSYPFEVDELKAFVAAPEGLTAALLPDREEGNTEPSFVAVKTAPSKKIVVVMPADVKPRRIVELAPSLEQKAEALRQRALNYQPSTTTTEVLEHVGLRSPGKIIQDGVGQTNRKKKRHGHYVESRLLFATAFCAIAVISFFIIQNKPQNINLSQMGPTAKTKEDKVLVKTGSGHAKPNTTATDTPASSIAFVTSNLKAVVNDAAPMVINKEAAKETVPVKNAEVPSETLVKYDLSASRRPKGKVPDIPVNDLLQTTSQYIKSDDGIGLAITVENTAEQPIRTAAVDVVYFDKTKKEAAKKTIYFSNILPHTIVTKNSPYIKAASVSCRVGLVSTEKWGLYVMQ